MLALPRFMRTGVGMKPEPDELLAGFAVTGHFFERHVWGPRGQETPPARVAFLQLLERAARSGKTEGRGLQ
jgi:DNA repair protein RecO (recombination protein O)